MEKNISFRTIIEVLGKPKEHIEETIKGYVDKLKKDEKYQVDSVEFAEIKKQEKDELWATFAEIEVKTEKIENLIEFCFNFMPSLIEIIEPPEMQLKDQDISSFLNDLQARLHQVDMVAKQLKMENDYLKKNMQGLLKNYIQILLSKKGLTSEQLSTLTGVNKEKLEDYLDVLIDERKIDLKDGVYFKKEAEEDERKREEG